MKLALFFLSTLIFFPLFGQEKRPVSVAFLPKTGFLIAHRPLMSHLVRDRNTAFEIELSRQDNTGNFTSSCYRYFSQGISLHYQDYGYHDVLGQGYSILQFTKFCLIQQKRFGFLDFRVGSGISYLTKRYDVVENPKNNAIGSHVNAFINLQVVYTKYAGPFLFGGGLEISHYSNCAIRMPNLGLNTPMGFVKIGYAIGEFRVFDPLTCVVDTTTLRDTDAWQVQLIGSVRQTKPGYYPARSRPVAAVQALYRRQINHKWDIEAGADLIYNAANRYWYDDRSYTAMETVQLGFYTGVCANFYQSQIYFGIGGYVLNRINPAGWVYNRIGYRYNFGKHFNAMIGVKASLGIADYLEMGIGYRFN